MRSGYSPHFIDGAQRLSNLLEVTQLVTIRAGI